MKNSSFRLKEKKNNQVLSETQKKTDTLKTMENVSAVREKKVGIKNEMIFDSL